MKKILSLLLFISLVLISLVSCGAPEEDIEGYFTSGGVGYFFTEDGVIVVKDGSATSTTFTQSEGIYTVDGATINKSDLTPGDFIAPIMGNVEYFTYETEGDVKSITGLTDEGKKQSVLFVPEGVTNIATEAFKASTNLEAFVIGKTSYPLNLSNGAFAGTDIDLYIVAEMAPGVDIVCGNNMLTGTDDIDIKIESEAYSTYTQHYTWGNFADYIEKY